MTTWFVTALAAAVWAVVLSVYWTTGFTSLSGGDSGELAAEACRAGVAHPPGYPLFILVGRTFVALSQDANESPILALNRVCTVMGSMSGLLQFVSAWKLASLMEDAAPPSGTLKSIVRLTAKGALSASIALVSCFTPLMWTYNTQTEVFAMNNFLVSALLCLVIVISERTAHSGFPGALGLCFAVLAGLALCNQHTSVLFIAPMALFIIALHVLYYRFTIISFVQYAGFTFLGLSPYAWLFVGHKWFRQPGSWGDASTLPGFLRHVLRQDYGTFKLLSKQPTRTAGGVEDGLWERNSAYWLDVIVNQLPAGWWVLVIVGAMASIVFALSAAFPKNITTETPASTNSANAMTAKAKDSSRIPRAGSRPGVATFRATASQESHATTGPLPQVSFSAKNSVPALLLTVVCVYFGVFHTLSNMPLKDPLLYGVHARFWMQPTLALLLLVVVGVMLACDMVERFCVRLCLRDQAANAGARWYPFHLLVGILMGASAVQQIRTHYAANDNSRNDAMVRYGRALLSTLPPHAILVTGYDMQWTAVQYLQACEGLRPDVAVLNAPVMSFSWFAAQRHLYPGVSFPGTHLVSHLTAPHAAGGFSLADFVAANTAEDKGAALVASYVGSDKPHPSFASPRDSMLSPAGRCGNGSSFPGCSGDVFYGGVFVYSDEPDVRTQFELVPHGIVSRIVPTFRAARSRLVTWRNITKSSLRPQDAAGPRRSIAQRKLDVAVAWKAWRDAETVPGSCISSRDENGNGSSLKLAQHCGPAGVGRVNVSQQGPATWEFATRVDTWDQAVVYGTWLLEWALLAPTGAATGDTEYVNATAAMEALRVLEEALAMQLEHNGTVAASTYKNIGLACVRLVRSSQRLQAPLGSNGLPQWPALPQLRELKKNKVDETSWRTAASLRVLETWGLYETLPESAQDSGIASIRNVVQVLRDVQRRTAQPPGP